MFRSKCLSLLLFIFLLCSLAVANQQIKNVIFLIGDGLGANQRLAATLYLERPLTMEDGVKSMITTYSANSSVTDSAAAATALATGQKTNNGMLSISPTGEILPTILELARKKGLVTGLVVTDSITGATPAAFAAHRYDRSDQQGIADDYFTNKVDLLFGGGREWFLPATKGGKRTDNRDLIEEFQGVGYKYIERLEQLDELSTLPAIGLFSRGSLPYRSDLAKMTKKALELLSQEEKGFFLMVEGSRIDHACHANDLTATIFEVVAFDEAVSVALKFVKDNPDTLVIVTADHETGGLTFTGEDGDFRFVKIYSTLPQAMVDILEHDRANAYDFFCEQTGLMLDVEMFEWVMGLSDLETGISLLMKEEIEKIYPDFQWSTGGHKGVKWTTTGHSGVSVPLNTFGVGAELFREVKDNTHVPQIIAKLLELEE